MDQKKQLNPLAPVFIPGQEWQRGEVRSDVRQGSAAQPLIVYGDLDGNGRSVSRMASHDPNQPTFQTIRHRIHELVRTTHRSQRTIDNTSRAARARLTFDWYFGNDEQILSGWQDLCYYCGMPPNLMPMTIHDCRYWLSKQFVNVFDLVEAARQQRVAEPRFDNAHELEIYSRQTGKICPVTAGAGNQLFQFMLKRWFSR